VRIERRAEGEVENVDGGAEERVREERRAKCVGRQWSKRGGGTGGWRGVVLEALEEEEGEEADVVDRVVEVGVEEGLQERQIRVDLQGEEERKGREREETRERMATDQVERHAEERVQHAEDACADGADVAQLCQEHEVRVAVQEIRRCIREERREERRGCRWGLSWDSQAGLGTGGLGRRD
jgi:hypothetical protein